MIGAIFWGILWTQMAVLTVVLYDFNLDLIGLSIPGLLIFVFSWLPSDLSAVLHLRELAIATHGKAFSVKFVEVPSSSNFLYPGSEPFFSPVQI